MDTSSPSGQPQDWEKFFSDWALNLPSSYELPTGIPVDFALDIQGAFQHGQITFKSGNPVPFKSANNISQIQQYILNHFVQLGIEKAQAAQHPPAPSVPTPSQVQPTQQPSESSVLKISPPEHFTGRPDKFRNFATQLQLCFQAYPQSFNTEHKKITFAASYLRDSAYNWLSTFLDPQTGTISFKSYSDFYTSLKAAFDDPDSTRTAERKLQSLKQDKSCAAYYSQFMTLISLLNWTEDSVKISLFHSGLKDSVKDLLIGKTKPTTFEAYAQLCISLDNEWFARQSEKRSHHSSPQTSSSSTKPKTSTTPQTFPKPATQFSVQLQHTSSSGGDPMDLDALRKERREHRIKNNLCLYCGEPGHQARNCPKSKARNTVNSISQDTQDQDSSQEPAATNCLYQLGEATDQ